MGPTNLIGAQRVYSSGVSQVGSGEGLAILPSLAQLGPAWTISNAKLMQGRRSKSNFKKVWHDGDSNGYEDLGQWG